MLTAFTGSSGFVFLRAAYFRVIFILLIIALLSIQSFASVGIENSEVIAEFIRNFSQYKGTESRLVVRIIFSFLENVNEVIASVLILKLVRDFLSSDSETIYKHTKKKYGDYVVSVIALFWKVLRGGGKWLEHIIFAAPILAVYRARGVHKKQLDTIAYKLGTGILRASIIPECSNRPQALDCKQRLERTEKLPLTWFLSKTVREDLEDQAGLEVETLLPQIKEKLAKAQRIGSAR
jgi:hypothetical protein